MPPGTVYTFNLAAGLARPPADGMMGGGTPVGVRVAASADNNLIAAAVVARVSVTTGVPADAETVAVGGRGTL